MSQEMSRPEKQQFVYAPLAVSFAEGGMHSCLDKNFYRVTMETWKIIYMPQ